MVQIVEGCDLRLKFFRKLFVKVCIGLVVVAYVSDVFVVADVRFVVREILKHQCNQFGGFLCSLELR